MKILCLCILLLFAGTPSFAQQTEPADPRTVELYLEKSKSQKASARLLMGIGVATLAVTSMVAVADGARAFGNLILGEPQEQERFYVVPITFATASITGSIILFTAAARNKRRALMASTYLQLEKYPARYHPRFAGNTYPSIALRIKL